MPKKLDPKPGKPPTIPDPYRCENCGTTTGEIKKVALKRISDEHGQEYWSRPFKLCRSCRSRAGATRACE